MNYIAVDTASGTLKVLVSYGGKTEYRSDISFKSASEKLLVLIDSALGELGAGIGDMDFFACVTGPGSFTGIRIGMATVKAFAYVTGKKIVPVNSLELLAACRPGDTTVAVADASNGMRYVAVYGRGGAEVMSPRAIGEKELCDFLSMVDEPHQIVADAVSGAGIADAFVPADFREAFRFTVENRVSGAVDGNLAEPLYIRKPQALADMERKNSGA